MGSENMRVGGERRSLTVELALQGSKGERFGLKP